MSKPTILCDIDGVLTNFTSTYLDLLYAFTGRRHPQSAVTSFNFTECVSSKYEDAAIWRHIAATPGLVRDLPLYDGALDFLAELRKAGRVVACTSPAGPLWTAERSQWLLEVAGFHKRDIVIASDKALVCGDFLIDDAVHNITEWEAAYVGDGGIVMGRPWNAHWTGERCHDYEDVLDFFDVIDWSATNWNRFRGKGVAA